MPQDSRHISARSRALARLRKEYEKRFRELVREELAKIGEKKPTRVKTTKSVRVLMRREALKLRGEGATYDGIAAKLEVSHRTAWMLVNACNDDGTYMEGQTVAPKQIRVLVIRPGEKGKEDTISRRSWVDDISALLDNAYVAPCNVIPNIAFYADEEGQMKNLPVNQEATNLIQLAAGGREIVPLLGPIVISGNIKNGFPTDYDFEEANASERSGILRLETNR